MKQVWLELKNLFKKKNKSKMILSEIILSEYDFISMIKEEINNYGTKIDYLFLEFDFEDRYGKLYVYNSYVRNGILTYNPDTQSFYTDGQLIIE